MTRRQHARASTNGSDPGPVYRPPLKGRSAGGSGGIFGRALHACLHRTRLAERGRPPYSSPSLPLTGTLAQAVAGVKQALFSHNKRYRLCRMRYEESRDTDHNRGVEEMLREQLRSSPSAGHRPADSEAVSGSWPTVLGLRPVEGSEAQVHESQASEAGTDERERCSGEEVAGGDGVLPGEAGSHSEIGRDRGFGIHNTPILASGRVGPSQYQEATAPVPEWAGHATW